MCLINLFIYKSLNNIISPEAVAQRRSLKKVFLETSQNSLENNRARVSFFNKVAKKETLAQLFFCEFCEISKNTFFHRTTLVAASVSHILRSNFANFFANFLTSLIWDELR